MSDPISALPPWAAERLALLLDAIGDVPVTPFERASLAILARQEPTATVLNLADLLRRCRLAQPGQPDPASEQVPACNNTSVGILIVRDGHLLMIHRRKPPYGWAPPAGHIDDGETCEQAARRELLEEVGLRALDLSLVWSGRRDNRCRRPSGDFHHWRVYEAAAFGEPVRSLEETHAIGWVGPDWLHSLAMRTRLYRDGLVTEDQWQELPGLEPVWLDMLTDLGWWSA